MKANGWCPLANGAMMSAVTLMASPTAALIQQQIDWCVNASHQSRPSKPGDRAANALLLRCYTTI